MLVSEQAAIELVVPDLPHEERVTLWVAGSEIQSGRGVYWGQRLKKRTLRSGNPVQYLTEHSFGVGSFNV